MNSCTHARLDRADFRGTVASSRSRQGAFARHCDGRAGCGVPRVAYASKPPGGSGNPPSATTSGREELADGEAVTCFIPRGTGAKNRRGGAPRGERPRWTQGACVKARYARLHALCACGPTSLARRRVPLHPSACRRSAPLIGDEGKHANLGGRMPRENDEACAVVPGLSHQRVYARLRRAMAKPGTCPRPPRISLCSIQATSCN